MLDKKKLLKFEIISTILIMFLGTILHFTYNFSNYNNLVALFSAVNESVWEHLKLLFFPTLLTIIIGYLYLKQDYSNYLCIKTKGLLIALGFIIIFFYTYTGVIGKNLAVVDIASFFIAVLILEIYTYKKLLIKNYCNSFLTITVLFLLTIAFGIFTFMPPKIGLFKDPQTNTYGVQK